LATLLHWSVMAALILCGVSALAATTLGAVAGALANYRLQARWVFTHTTRRAGRRPIHRLATYVCTVLLGWCINAGVFAVLAAPWPIWLAQAGAHAAVTAANFILYRGVVFHEGTD